jgi:hypothetical protein
VSQEDAANHFATFIINREGDLTLTLGDVLEPARALIGRHPPRTGTDQQLLGIVRPGLPRVDISAGKRSHPRPWSSRDDRIAVSDCHGPVKNQSDRNRYASGAMGSDRSYGVRQRDAEE